MKCHPTRQQLYGDPRLAALNALAEIELLPCAELEAWKDAIAAIQVVKGATSHRNRSGAATELWPQTRFPPQDLYE